MTTATPTFVNDSFKMMTDTFSKAVQTGTKMFEENTRLANEFATRSTEQFRANWDKFNSDFMPLSKSTTERFQRFFDEQTRRNHEFFRDAVDTRPTMNPAEFSERVANFWSHCFSTLRETTEACAKVGNDAFQNWTEWNRNFVESCAKEPTKPAPAKK